MLGRVDGCFANAGVSGRGGIDLVRRDDAEEWRRVLKVNLDGAFFTFRAAARHMVERGGGGVLVGTASLAAIEGAARSEHYAATKGGLISMIRALAVEFARHGVRANAILPGWIETDMTANAIGNEKFAKNVLPRIPMRRWGTRRRLRRHRRLPDELGLRLSHRRHLPHRRRLRAVLGGRRRGGSHATISGCPKP